MIFPCEIKSAELKIFPDSSVVAAPITTAVSETLEAISFNELIFCFISVLFSKRSIGGYPIVANSGNTIISAFCFSDSSMRLMILFLLPEMSPTIGLNWARAIFISTYIVFSTMFLSVLFNSILNTSSFSSAKIS